MSHGRPVLRLAPADRPPPRPPGPEMVGAAGLPAPHAPLFVPRVPAALCSTPWALARRLNAAVLLNRLKRPFSRLRHARRDAALAERFDKAPLPAMPEAGDVCIIGAFGARNGLSRAARYELAHLQERFPAADVVDVGAGPAALEDYAAAHAGRPPALVIVLLQPNRMAAVLGGIDPAFLRSAYRICLAVWELPYFPPDWRAANRLFHEYWTPSTFSAAALRSGTAALVRVAPHPVRLPVAAFPRAPARPGPFRGLAIMDLSTCPDRKNPWAHVEAWQKAFGEAPDCVLTLKLRFSARTAGVRRELRRMIGDAPNIRIIEQEMSDEAVMQLQVANDVCLSLHRAEGFGLTICEMLALGKAAVATNWSGNVDVMARYADAYPVRYTLVPYRDYLRRYPGYHGSWAEADTDHAARCLRVVAARCRRAAGSSVAGPQRD